MKYYAVTDDPAELMHYGIKGMRWGVTRTPAQLGHPTRSAAYKRASGKLSAMMRKGIEKAETKWKTYNSPANKRARAKARAEAKSERQVERALSQMRKSGKAKLGKLSDAQIQRVTERLRLEQQARNLGGMEKRGMLGRIREAAGEGLVRGVAQGTAGYIEARARARGAYKAAKKWSRKEAQIEARNERIKAHERAKQEAKDFKKYSEEKARIQAENNALANDIKAKNEYRVMRKYGAKKARLAGENAAMVKRLTAANDYALAKQYDPKRAKLSAKTSADIAAYNARRAANTSRRTMWNEERSRVDREYYKNRADSGKMGMGAKGSYFRRRSVANARKAAMKIPESASVSPAPQPTTSAQGPRLIRPKTSNISGGSRRRIRGRK